MSLVILNLRHYNTPTVEGIVHPSSNIGYQMDRLPDHKYHNRDGYRLSNFAKFAESNCGRSDHNRRGYVRRAEGLTLMLSGKASQGRGSGRNIPGASFPIWSTIVL